MTREEMVHVLAVIAGADNGCDFCVAQLVDDLLQRLPEHPWREVAESAEFAGHTFAHLVQEALDPDLNRPTRATDVRDILWNVVDGKGTMSASGVAPVVAVSVGADLLVSQYPLPVARMV